ncbi:Uncharacterised protein [Mycobacteroides abscessus subsp. abscessus]|nr:Uncharacterised protein [Mycobacteroides abscessus subsp. abscessus]
MAYRVGRAAAPRGQFQRDRAQRTLLHEPSGTDRSDRAAGLLHPMRRRGGRPAVRPQQLRLFFGIRTAAADIHRPCRVDVIYLIEFRSGGGGKQIADSRAGTHTDHRTDTVRTCDLVKAEHLQRGLPIIADVQVVGSGLNCHAQHRQSKTEVRTDGVQDQINIFECCPERSLIGHVNAHSSSRDRPLPQASY